MSGQHALQSTPAPAEQSHRDRHRVYTVAQLLSVDMLNMKARTFRRLKKEGKLPFLVEIEPRAGRLIRYLADPIDRYLDGLHGQPRFFASARRAGGR